MTRQTEQFNINWLKLLDTVLIIFNPKLKWWNIDFYFLFIYLLSVYKVRLATLSWKRRLSHNININISHIKSNQITTIASYSKGCIYHCSLFLINCWVSYQVVVTQCHRWKICAITHMGHTHNGVYWAFNISLEACHNIPGEPERHDYYHKNPEESGDFTEEKGMWREGGNIMADPQFYNALYGINYRLPNVT